MGTSRTERKALARRSVPPVISSYLQNRKKTNCYSQGEHFKDQKKETKKQVCLNPAHAQPPCESVLMLKRPNTSGFKAGSCCRI